MSMFTDGHGENETKDETKDNSMMTTHEKVIEILKLRIKARRKAATNGGRYVRYRPEDRDSRRKTWWRMEWASKRGRAWRSEHRARRIDWIFRILARNGGDVAMEDRAIAIIHEWFQNGGAR
jgi:hypothetical protein